MKTLIYSDVHGNLPAFEKMLEDEGSCDNYVCLGDLVNYGPWGDECVDLAASLPNSILLMGNHEEAFIQGEYPGINPLVQKFFEITFQRFTKSDQIIKFQTETKIGDFILSHTINNVYVYPDTAITLTKNHIIGHSHHQFKYSSNGFTLFNSGSVGQNRRFINLANYLIYNHDSGMIEMKSVEFNFDLLISEMKRNSYPQECLDYYLQKAKYNG